MKLTTYLGEYNKISISITVEYCPKTNYVEEVLSVVAREESKTMPVVSYIDMTDLFMKHFENDLDKLIMETDWRQLYAEYKTELLEHQTEISKYE